MEPLDYRSSALPIDLERIFFALLNFSYLPSNLLLNSIPKTSQINYAKSRRPDLTLLAWISWLAQF